MYPRNAASPEPVAIGAVVQISDGAVQTSGCTVRIKPIGVAEADGGGTTAYSTDGIVLYTPTQAETNYTSFILIAKKTGCIPVSITVVTSASATAGYAGTDQSKITNATSTVNLSGTTIKTATDVETDTADIQTRIPAALTAGGNIKADALAISGDATAADNLEADYDGLGSNSQRPVSAKFLADVIETQRGSHAWSGNWYYVDGFGGNDTTGDGSRALPWKTISKALTAVTSGNHDVIECLGNPSQIPTVISETSTVTITKAYTFIRGPGRGVQVDLTGAGYVFDIQAVGVEISGFDLVGNGTGNSGGVLVSTADFARLRRLWISSPTQDGIQCTVSNNSLIEECVVTGAGRDNIRIASGTGTGQYTRILDCTIRDAVGSGVNLIGVDASESQIRRCIIRDNAVGVTVGSGTTDTVITDNRFINNATTISDSGTRTMQAWNFLTTTEAGGVTVTTNSDKTGYSLTATTGLGNQTADITGSLSGSVGSVTGAVGSVTGNVGGNVTGSVGSIATGGIATTSFAAGAIDAAAIAADAGNEIADAILTRNVSNVEATAGEHTLCTIILATLEWEISGGNWLIKRTNGTTTHATKPVTTDAGGNPIIGVS